MITIFITAEHTYTWHHFLDTSVGSMGSEIQFIPYGSSVDVLSLAKGVVIFTDIDRLVLLQKMAAVRVHEQLLRLRPDITVLNSPRHSLTRYKLLTLLHERGINRFTVFRADKDWGSARFPVFVRIADDHSAPRTPLISTATEAEVEIRRLCGWERWKKKAKKAGSHGDRASPEPVPVQRVTRDRSFAGYLSRARRRLHFRRDVIVAEFAATADHEGLYHKYGAFVVGGQIVPAHLWFSNHWVVKFSSSRQDPEYLDRELQYLHTNPHSEQLLEICSLADIQFGRIDYSVDRNGHLQVWEINTNPQILPDIADPVLAAKREPTHEWFVKGFRSALRELEKSVGAMKAPEDLTDPALSAVGMAGIGQFW